MSLSCPWSCRDVYDIRPTKDRIPLLFIQPFEMLLDVFLELHNFDFEVTYFMFSRTPPYVVVTKRAFILSLLCLLAQEPAVLGISM